MANVQTMVVREIHETVKHIAHVHRVVPAVFEGTRYEMPAPDTTVTLCNKPVLNGIIDGPVEEHNVSVVECDDCRTAHLQRVAALYYGEDGE